MSRIIIDNKSSLPDYDAVNAVQRVMSDGFQSTETIQGEKNIPKYCDATTFTHKVKGTRITVVVCVTMSALKSVTDVERSVPALIGKLNTCEKYPADLLAPKACPASYQTSSLTL